jgi:hypothetical protein
MSIAYAVVDGLLAEGMERRGLAEALAEDWA